MSTFHAYVDAAHFHEALGNVLRFAAKRSRLPILEEAQVILDACQSGIRELEQELKKPAGKVIALPSQPALKQKEAA